MGSLSLSTGTMRWEVGETGVQRPVLLGRARNSVWLEKERWAGPRAGVLRATEGLSLISRRGVASRRLALLYQEISIEKGLGCWEELGGCLRGGVQRLLQLSPSVSIHLKCICVNPRSVCLALYTKQLLET